MVYQDLAVAVLYGLVRFITSAVLAIFSVYFGIRAFDKLTQGIHELEELKKGNAAVGILIAAIIISIAAVVRSGVFEFVEGIQPGYSIPLLLALAFINLVKLAFGLIVAVLTIYISLAILDKLTAGIDEVKELKHGNIGIAIFIAGILLSVSIVVDAGLESMEKSPAIDACVIAQGLPEAGIPLNASGCSAPVEVADSTGK